MMILHQKDRIAVAKAKCQQVFSKDVVNKTLSFWQTLRKTLGIETNKNRSREVNRGVGSLQ